jgi:hypothetical protein
MDLSGVHLLLIAFGAAQTSACSGLAVILTSVAYTKRADMARSISYLLTALFTFLVGVALHSSYRFGVDPQPAEAEIQTSFQIPPVDQQTFQVPLRVGIFAGVDGVTFSTDNSRFNLFDDYREREIAIMVPPEELTEMVHKLMAAGLLDERQWNSSFAISLPVNNTIMIAWPDKVRTFTWIHDNECRVPEKYLSVLEEVNVRYGARLIKDLITYNRRARSVSLVEPSTVAEADSK